MILFRKILKKNNTNFIFYLFRWSYKRAQNKYRPSLQKCISSHLYLSNVSKNCIGEIVVYILLPLYLLLASVSSCTASIVGIDHLDFSAKVYIFTPLLINSFNELDWWDSCLHSTAFIPDDIICIKEDFIYHWYRPPCFPCKSVHLHTCTVSTASKNCIGEIVVYILLRLYLMLASVSSCMYCIYHWNRPSCFSCKSVHLNTCTYQLL